MTQKKYGGDDFGSTLEQLKRMAPLAATVDGVKFEGNGAKVGAILGLAGVGGELIAEIEAQRAILAKFVEHFDQNQRAGLTEDEMIDSDLVWFEAVDGARALLGIEYTEPFVVTNRFAKLFHFEDIGQVLVKRDSNDDGPEVRFYFQPEGLGICSVALNFKGSDAEQADAADEGFALTDREKAETIVRSALNSIPAGLAG